MPRPNRIQAMFDAMLQFVEAYDAWAQSKELCGGSLFDEMVQARQTLEEAWEECDEYRQDNGSHSSDP